MTHVAEHAPARPPHEALQLPVRRLPIVREPPLDTCRDRRRTPAASARPRTRRARRARPAGRAGLVGRALGLGVDRAPLIDRQDSPTRAQSRARTDLRPQQRRLPIAMHARSTRRCVHAARVSTSVDEDDRAPAGDATRSRSTTSASFASIGRAAIAHSDRRWRDRQAPSLRLAPAMTSAARRSRRRVISLPSTAIVSNSGGDALRAGDREPQQHERVLRSSSRAPRPTGARPPRASPSAKPSRASNRSTKSSSALPTSAGATSGIVISASTARVVEIAGEEVLGRRDELVELLDRARARAAAP